MSMGEKMRVISIVLFWQAQFRAVYHTDEKQQAFSSILILNRYIDLYRGQQKIVIRSQGFQG